MTIEETIEAALKHAKSLAQERLHRGTGLHADDQRIATEIAAYLFKLGKLQKDSFNLIDYHHRSVEAHFQQLARNKEAYALLQKELDICNYQ